MKVWLILGAVILVAGGGIYLKGKGGFGSSDDTSRPIAEVQRGNLTIDVLEGGNIEALNFLEIINEVRQPYGIKILEIIDEGYYVTEEDVESEKVLVRLDSSSLEEELVDHDVEFQETEADFAESKQNIEIAESEALSEIKAERQKLRFALLDFEKFVGEEAARDILKQLRLPHDQESLERYEMEATTLITEAFDARSLAETTDDSELTPEAALETEDSLATTVDFGRILEKELLGDGEAEQTIRRMRDEALVSASQLAVVEESVQGARRLEEREFITRQALENELVSLEKARLQLQTNETELELFRDYEFPKEAEKMLSYYEESLLSLIRTKRELMAKMSQLYAKFSARKRRYDLELKKRQNLEEQLASCVIRAEVTGLVAYGGAKSNPYTSRYYDGISPGATLKTGQPIITIPDMSQLGVDVSIHESHIKKIEIGQTAYITAESVPDELLIGEVSKVAVLPDSNASRYNPSLKVYPATIEIDGKHEFLKPGMTAKVEIIIDQLEDVLYVPVQSVFSENDDQFVFVDTLTGYERRLVDVGQHNNEFIEIQGGVEEGETVRLRKPEDYEPAPLEVTHRSRPKPEPAEKTARSNDTTAPQKPPRA
ncbi:MAG: efflux RND transporter periplasmic adaptor subunit [Verrucomicrobiota bacterium]